MTDTNEHPPMINGLQGPIEPETVRRWVTSAAVVVAAGCMAYSAWLQYIIAKEVSRGPDLYAVEAKLDEIDRSLGRMATQISRTASTESADPYAAMFEKDAGDIVDSIERQTRVIEYEEARTRNALIAYR